MVPESKRLSPEMHKVSVGKGMYFPDLMQVRGPHEFNARLLAALKKPIND